MKKMFFALMLLAALLLAGCCIPVVDYCIDFSLPTEPAYHEVGIQGAPGFMITGANQVELSGNVKAECEETCANMGYVFQDYRFNTTEADGYYYTTYVVCGCLDKEE